VGAVRQKKGVNLPKPGQWLASPIEKKREKKERKKKCPQRRRLRRIEKRGGGTGGTASFDAPDDAATLHKEKKTPMPILAGGWKRERGGEI